MEFFNGINWFDILATIGYVILGGFVAYYKGSEVIKGKVADTIRIAEKEFKGVQRGGERFEWAVDYLYNLMPTPARMFINRDFIGNIVQQTFDCMTAFAKTQLDKAVEAVTDTPEKKEGA